MKITAAASVSLRQCSHCQSSPKKQRKNFCSFQVRSCCVITEKLNRGFSPLFLLSAEQYTTNNSTNTECTCLWEGEFFKKKRKKENKKKLECNGFMINVRSYIVMFSAPKMSVNILYREYGNKSV